MHQEEAKGAAGPARGVGSPAGPEPEGPPGAGAAGGAGTSGLAGTAGTAGVAGVTGAAGMPTGVPSSAMGSGGEAQAVPGSGLAPGAEAGGPREEAEAQEGPGRDMLQSGGSWDVAIEGVASAHHPSRRVTLHGTLTSPQGANALVIFAHGSGRWVPTREGSWGGPKDFSLGPLCKLQVA